MNVTAFGNQPFAVVKCRATEPQFQQFAAGASSVLRQWTALNLVTLHCDPSAADHLLQHVLQWFLRDGEVYSDELELFFEDFFAAARSVVLEDDSMKEVGDTLHDMYCMCCHDDFSKVQHFLSMETMYRQMDPIAHSMNGTVDNDLADDADLGEAEGGADNEEELEVASAQPIQRNRRKKNAYNKSADGWNIRWSDLIIIPFPPSISLLSRIQKVFCPGASRSSPRTPPLPAKEINLETIITSKLCTGLPRSDNGDSPKGDSTLYVIKTYVLLYLILLLLLSLSLSLSIYFILCGSPCCRDICSVLFHQPSTEALAFRCVAH
eukprot:gene8697-6117_t